MKPIAKLSAISSALALTGILAFGGQAVADTVKGTYEGYKLTRGVKVSIDSGRSYKSTVGGYADFLGTSENPKDGLDGSSLVGPGDSANIQDFIGFCVDVPDPIGGSTGSGPFTWAVIDLAKAPDPVDDNFMGATKADNISRMLATYLPDFSKVTTKNADYVAGLQIAIWEIIYEDPSDQYDLTSGTAQFKEIGGGAAASATSFLDTSLWAKDGLNNLVALSLPIGTEHAPQVQDFVVQVVPIPAAAWLFGSALMGTLALGRRKLKKGEVAA